MNVLLVGGGGREHALVHVLAGEGQTLICAPGNPGVARQARCVGVDAGNPAGLLRRLKS